MVMSGKARRPGAWIGAAACAVFMNIAHAQATPAAEAKAPSAVPVTRQPLERFARRPMLTNVSLSPDGRRIAALMNLDDRTLLITRAVTGGDVKVLLSTDNSEFNFAWINWVGNDRVVTSVRFASRRYFMGTVETRLLSIKADGSGLVNLVRNAPRAGSTTVITQQIQDRVVDWMPRDGKHILLALADAERVLPAVYKVNVETGARQMVKAPERDVYEWVTDAQHRVRVGVRRTDDGLYEVRGSDPDGKNWRTLWSYKDFKDEVDPLGFGVDPQELFVRADHEGRMAVFSVRLDDPALTRRLRLAHAERDIDGSLLVSPASGDALGMRGSGVEDADGEGRAEVWSPPWRELLRAIDKGLPDRRNRLVDVSLDEQLYVLHSSGNGKPPEYYLGDRRTGEAALLGETYPDLDPSRLVGKHAVAIQARDGLQLNAFLTLPHGRQRGDGRGALPMVLLPHGGPHSRDGDEFDTWTEFLADRGYAVLQVNFRGSSGYGHEFESAGLRRWGLEMQDDLSDAVQWAVTQSLADGARVCIVGASYGGYAALMGVVKTPEAYRCAVSFAGVSDLIDLVSHSSQYVGGRQRAEMSIGKAWGDRERLRDTSPALQAARIQAPVLLVHGTSDRIVPVEQSQDMAKALRRAGKSYRYIEQEGGDHWLSRFQHRLEFFRALESFLDHHLKPAAAAATGASPGG